MSTDSRTLTPPPLLILKTGTTLASLVSECGDFEDWIRAAIGWDRDRVEVVAAPEVEALPDPERYAGVIVTGSSAMVSDRAAWSERAATWLRGAVESGASVLGICFGHQLLAHALGGRVGPNPSGRQIGTTALTLGEAASDDPLLEGFASPLRAHFTHCEAVLELPAAARRLGASAGDPNAAFAIGGSCWGVQFHPEFDARVMRRYIEERRDALLAEAIDATGRLREVRECPEGPALLRRFGELLERRRRGADEGKHRVEACADGRRERAQRGC